MCGEKINAINCYFVKLRLFCYEFSFHFFNRSRRWELDWASIAVVPKASAVYPLLHLSHDSRLEFFANFNLAMVEAIVAEKLFIDVVTFAENFARMRIW